MTSLSNLPAIIAIQDEQVDRGYKLYDSRLYYNGTEYINIIAPIENYDLEAVYKYETEGLQPYYVSLIRKWSGGIVTSSEWTYTDYELSVKDCHSNLVIRVPVISVSTDTGDLVPDGARLITKAGNHIELIEFASMYDDPLIYTSDPYCRVVAPPVPTAPAAPVASIPTMPAHVKRIVIQDAIRKGDSCVISFNDITEKNASLTSCGHVFTTEAIQKWLSQSSSGGCCPLCKQQCHLV
jgi:hypothetical protein